MSLPRKRLILPVAVASALVVGPAGPVAQSRPGLSSADLYELASVGDVQLAPGGARVAYTVTRNPREGRPRSEVWLLDLADGRRSRLGTDQEAASGPRWAPDSRRLAFFGRHDGEYGVLVSDAAGGGLRLVAPVTGTNHPLPSAGERLVWSPDGSRLAFISTTPGPETGQANGDPMVITRYLYKPTASEGLTRFNDNRRTHIFVADLAAGRVEQLTDGPYYEHSLDWSPDGAELLFVSNREPDPDRFFNYDIFAVGLAHRSVRRLTATKNAEYTPKWSPDGRQIAYLGTMRELTSSETTMEDTHVWVMAADGSRRREVGKLDRRQGQPDWAPGGDAVLATTQHRGSVGLHRFPLDGEPSPVVDHVGSMGAWSMATSGSLTYAFTAPGSPSELVHRPTLDGADRPLTDLNGAFLSGRTVAGVTPFTFKAADGLDVEAFLTHPVARPDGGRVPMIVMIHGGPHGQQGPGFTHKAQAYASEGWATLMVNYRGSTGYGQGFADAIFKDQNGAEARDVVAGVDAALARFPWLDGSRLGIEGGSYGGQLTNWIVTETDRFKAAISIAGISNLVSFNYMAYYHDYLAVEFGAFPHEQGLMDLLWERSPIRYVHKVRTPTLLVHGENDNDVPIAEAEQFYIALKDVGVETVMIRYPREGHGIREPVHVVDLIDRSVSWYRRHFGDRPSSNAPQREGGR
jgi:dipeptidyl aminopeptidase/acylaminoacyl peptidase